MENLSFEEESTSLVCWTHPTKLKVECVTGQDTVNAEHRHCHGIGEGRTQQNKLLPNTSLGCLPNLNTTQHLIPINLD